MQLAKGQVKCRVRRSLRDVRDSKLSGGMPCKQGTPASIHNNIRSFQLQATNPARGGGLK